MTKSSFNSIYIGLMSGTSMDGIDAALVDVASHQCLFGITRPYSIEAKDWLQRILAASTIEIHHVLQLNSILGKEFANAVLELLEKANYRKEKVMAIGSHGQTICHNAMDAIPYTLQLACPHTIAHMTGIPVVADFRTRDMVAGGQGAPFAPLYHREIFGIHQEPMVIVNIGGITNITYLDPRSEVIGFDVGPGNCLMDAWIGKCFNKSFDASGDWARQGEVIATLLDALLQDSFFHLPPPKSIGKEYFSLNWLKANLKQEYANQDIQATLLELTACSIQQSIARLLQMNVPVILCGGGVHNSALVESLKRKLPQHQIVSSSQYGINPDYLEAMMFAWLAKEAMTGAKIDLTSITGSRLPVSLGAIYPA